MKKISKRVYRGHTCPQFGLKAIFKQRDRIVKNAQCLIGKEVSGEVIDRLINIFRNFISACRRHTIEDSLIVLRGQVLTEELLIDNTWRICGNTSQIRQGIPVTAWSAQRMIEWAPFWIDSLIFEDQSDLLLMRFRVLAGTACPMIITSRWSMGKAFWISRKIGFTGSYGKYPYGLPTDLIGMRFAAVLEPERSFNQPVFSVDSIECLPSMLKRNRQLIRAKRDYALSL